MVLALATSANAALSLDLSATTVAVGDTVTCSIYSDNISPWTESFILSEDTYAWTDPVAAAYNGVTIGPGAGDLASAIPNPTYPALIQLTAGGMGVSAGVQFIISIIGVQPGTIYLDLVGGSAGIPEIPTLVVVPEPMTITLLALGGLLLHRNRKNLKL